MQKIDCNNLINMKWEIPKIQIIKSKLSLKIILILSLLILIVSIKFIFSQKFDQISFDHYETNIFNNIKDKLINTTCSIMWGNQREFINGIIRKSKPKKILELGVHYGGCSIIILNAIKDLKNSYLYSIDLSSNKYIGSCVKNLFPNLLKKWTLFKGNVAAQFMDKIGKNIDLAMIDTSHFEPGEILDFIMILPFLKEEAIVIFHDIDMQITHSKGKDKRYEWAPYLIFNIIRGEKYLPSGPGILNKDIGAIKLEKNQKKFIHDYCRALGGQWQYFPKEKHIKTIKNFFRKYHDNFCFNVLEESIEFNRQFVKDNYIEDYYAKLKRERIKKLNKTTVKNRNFSKTIK